MNHRGAQTVPLGGAIDEVLPALRAGNLGTYGRKR